MSELHTELDGHQLTLTNLDKVLYPVAGVTKGEIIDYYLRIAPTILPHLADRPLTRIRFPNGVDKSSFYEKNRPSGMPGWVPTLRVLAQGGAWGGQGRDAGEPIDYVMADSPATLVYLANLASLELHVPQWQGASAVKDAAGAIRLDDPDVAPRADLIVVDLDPGPGIETPHLVRAALLVAGRLTEDHLVPWVKTSGNKGLQVYAPIVPAPVRDAWGYVRDVAADLVARHPDRFVDVVAKDQRVERILVDVNQNLAARNTVAPYSLRAREQPTVSAPLTWDEVAAAERPEDLRVTMTEIFDRLDEHGDLALSDDHDRAALPPVGTPE